MGAVDLPSAGSRSNFSFPSFYKFLESLVVILLLRDLLSQENSLTYEFFSPNKLELISEIPDKQTKTFPHLNNSLKYATVTDGTIGVQLQPNHSLCAP